MIKESNYFYNAFLILKEAIAGKSNNKLEINSSFWFSLRKYRFSYICEIRAILSIEADKQHLDTLLVDPFFRFYPDNNNRQRDGFSPMKAG